MRNVLLLTLVMLFFGCARSPIKSPNEAMRLAAEMPELHDDLDFASLISGLEADVKWLREKLPSEHIFFFGPRQLSKETYLRSLERLLAVGKEDPTGARFREMIKSDFEPYEVYGDEDWGQIFMTSYYEPVIEGSKRQTERFSQGLYATPKDLVEVDIGSFVPARPALSVLSDVKFEQRSALNVLRGRLVNKDKDRLPRVVVFPDRAQIDGGAILDGAKFLAWVDPIDAFFLEIQGSGVVRLPNGKEIKVGYAAQNGYSYVPIGKFLLDKIPREKLTAHAIESHLRSLPLSEARLIMQKNPSYVFFRPIEKAGQSFLGTEVINGRTIATDQTYFPKGSLAFLEFEKPVFAQPTDTEPVRWEKTSRFVFDQDTGGAIRGPHRVDLFWGRGALAKQSAGVIKNKGRLIYFVPREK